MQEMKSPAPVISSISSLGGNGAGPPRRRFLRAGVHAAAALAVAACRGMIVPAPPRRVTLVDSARKGAPFRAADVAPGAPFRAAAVAMVGIFDIDWLSDPRFTRLLDTMAASPGAFRTVRVFGALSSGARE